MIRVLKFDGSEVVPVMGGSLEIRVGDEATFRVGRVRLPEGVSIEQAEAIAKSINSALAWLGGEGLQP